MKDKLKKIIFSKKIYPIFRPFYYPYFKISGGNGGREAKKYLKHLQEMEFNSIADWEYLQTIKLKKLVKEAYENVPYYRKMMKKMKIVPSDIVKVSDLGSFPILTKDIIRENLPELINKRYNVKKLKRILTGGTTGKPMMFFFSEHEIAVKCAHIEHWKRVSGVKQFDKYMYMAYDANAINRDDYNGTLTHTGFYYMNSVGLNDELMWRYYRQIKNLNPVYLRGYASACYSLAEFFSRNKIVFPLKVVMTSSDTLHPYQREVIEKTFFCKVYDFYHQAEDIVIAYECDFHHGFHVVMNSCIPEIINENGDLSKDEEEGTIVGTQLENLSMPLIRYETNDIGSITRKKCECGRSNIKIEKLNGRKTDVIILPNGKRISTGIGASLRTLYNEILEAQFVQKDKNSLIVKYVSNYSYTNRTEKKFEESIRKLIGKEIQIQFQRVQQIEKTIRGKHQLIISEYNRNEIIR